MDDSTRTLVIRRSNDETFDLFLDGEFIHSINLAGAGGDAGLACDAAKAVGKAFGADVIHEDIR